VRVTVDIITRGVQRPTAIGKIKPDCAIISRERGLSIENVKTREGDDYAANRNRTAKGNKIFDIAGFLIYRCNQSVKKYVRLNHTPGKTDRFNHV